MYSAIEYIKKKTNSFEPEIVLVLGSGLGSFADNLQGYNIRYEDIPGFGVSTVQGHKGELLFTKVGSKNVVIMSGRFHFYEGYSLAEATLPIKTFKKLGAKKIILTNAAGGINKNYKPGDLVLIKDHINFMGTNPLMGPNYETLGPRFPDMTSIYTPELRELARKCADKTGLSLQEGVYLATSGPSYETPSEIKMFEKWGADLVGMSTVPEAIVARWCGMKVLGISLCTNFAAGILETPLNHKEVVEAGQNASKKFTKLVKEILINI